jgi:hypothetical protein
MRYKIIDKLKNAGAISKDNAVNCTQAKLDPQEIYWLNYFAGVFLGKIKKTKNNHYYISSVNY